MYLKCGFGILNPPENLNPVKFQKVNNIDNWSPLALLLIRLPFPGDPPRGTIVISGVWYGRCVHTDSGVVDLEKDSRQSPSPNNQVTNIYLYMLYCSLNCQKVEFEEVTNYIHVIAILENSVNSSILTAAV